MHQKLRTMIFPMKKFNYEARLTSLDQFLCQTRSLWQPAPFKQEKPTWCEHYPELTQTLLSLSEKQLKSYLSNNTALIELVQTYIPGLALIAGLTELPVAATLNRQAVNPHLASGVPGRKWAQILAMYQKVKSRQLPVIDWCGGKGFLGRVISHQWQVDVTTVERQPSLVEAGQVLAQKFQSSQKFIKADVLHDEMKPIIQGHQTLALHACGDLHRQLVYNLVEQCAPAFSLIPCCYHLGKSDHYVTFNPQLKLKPDMEELRLAVNETVTAHHNEIVKRDRDMAWKLGFIQLRSDICGDDHYQPLKPVSKEWLGGNFKTFCQKLAKREELVIPESCDWGHYEQSAIERQRRVMRLQLLRHCFKRVLELWLVMDMTVFLQKSGYQVEVSEFCDRDMTPRNILITGFTATL